jgi:CDP-diacylglycerol--glycerol-3-phosphate 3-phosphatidyltransferase
MGSVDSESVEFLYNPNEFYSTLLPLFESARDRVYISTLYMGTSQLEHQLLNRLRDKPNVNFLIDGLRGNRKDSNNQSSVDLIRNICPNVTIDEFITPRFRGLYPHLPQRINEIVGTQHMKLIVVDDTCVITGANLSDIYFTNRQDRYLIFRNEKSLADKLVQVIRNRGELPPKTNIDTSCDENRVRISMSTQRGFNNPTLGESDTVTLELLQDAAKSENSIVTLASPYLNLSPDILECLLKLPRVNIVTNSSETNAFFGSRGPSKYIPEAYAIVEDDLLKSLDPSRISVFEYTRPGWSFHPKGIWVSRDSTLGDCIVGSSNFGYRSKFRDLEISVRMQNGSEKFHNQLSNELNGIMKFSKKVSLDRPKRPMWLKMLTRGPLRTFL